MDKYAQAALKAVQNYKGNNSIFEIYERATNAIFETKSLIIVFHN
jgi:hypothetical protein